MRGGKKLEIPYDSRNIKSYCIVCKIALRNAQLNYEVRGNLCGDCCTKIAEVARIRNFMESLLESDIKMELKELIKAVKEKELSKEQIEQYGDQMSELFAEMQLEMAELEKEEALFMDKSDLDSVAQVKVAWRATPGGQRLIVLKRYCLATKEVINSLKSRTYRLIY